MLTYHKLVRDRIPEIIESQGKKCTTLILEPDAYQEELRKKIQEEMQEYLSADGHKEAAEELADLLEVIYALASVHGVTERDLNEIRMLKRQQRGGFEERILLVEADE